MSESFPVTVVTLKVDDGTLYATPDAGQVRVDRAGLAAVTAVSATRGLHLHDDQAGCRDGTGQADAIAARSLQPLRLPAGRARSRRSTRSPRRTRHRRC